MFNDAPKYGMRREDDIEQVVKQHAEEVLEGRDDTRVTNMVPFKAKIYWRDSDGNEAIEQVGQMADTELFLQDMFKGMSEHGEHSLKTILAEYGKSSKPPNDHGLKEDRRPVAITISGEAVLINWSVFDQAKQETKFGGHYIMFCAGRTENGMTYIELYPLVVENEKHVIPNEDPPIELKKRLEEAKGSASDFMSAFFQGYQTGGPTNFKFLEN